MSFNTKYKIHTFFWIYFCCFFRDYHLYPRRSLSGIFSCWTFVFWLNAQSFGSLIHYCTVVWYINFYVINILYCFVSAYIVHLYLLFFFFMLLNKQLTLLSPPWLKLVTVIRKRTYSKVIEHTLCVGTYLTFNKIRVYLKY